MSNIANSSAGKRILSLLDENSFVEIGAKVTARATDFNLGQTETPSDGVITGYGVIDGNPVYVYSQDASVLGGSVGEMHAKKIANLYDLAIKTGAPVVGLLDSAGIRLQEATDALDAFGTIYNKMALASGVIPQITAVFGNCGGGLAVLAGMSDITLMEETKGKLFVSSPNAIEGNNESKLDTASAAYQAKETGVVDFIGDEASVLGQIRAYVSILPSNNLEEADSDCTDDLNRAAADMANCVGDTSIALSRIADDQAFYELKSAYAPDMVTGLMKLDGITVGAIANRTEVYDENGEVSEKFDAVISCKGAKKAAEFVEFCDAFEIPVITLTNTTGFKATECCEKNMAKSVAKLTYAFANATVPKINVIIGKAFGSAYVAMNSKSIGADMTYAWSNAQIGCMDAKLAAKIISADKADEIDATAKKYAELQNSVDSAAARGYVDTIIDAADTRKYVIGALEMLYTKSEDRPDKKHGTI